MCSRDFQVVAEAIFPHSPTGGRIARYWQGMRRIPASIGADNTAAGVGPQFSWVTVFKRWRSTWDRRAERPRRSCGGPGRRLESPAWEQRSRAGLAAPSPGPASTRATHIVQRFSRPNSCFSRRRPAFALPDRPSYSRLAAAGELAGTEQMRAPTSRQQCPRFAAQ